MRTLRQFLGALLAGPVMMACLAASVYAQRSNEGVPIRDANEARREAIDRRIRDILNEKVLSRQSGPTVKARQQGAQPFAIPQTRESAVSEDQQSEGEIHAAVNPADTGNIVVCAIKSDQAGFTLPIHYTKDFGQTWKTSSFVPSGQSGGDPVFVFGADGKLYFSWIEFNFLSQTETQALILSAPSTDGGETWGEIDTVIEAKGRVELDPSVGFRLVGEMADKQWMAADHGSSPYRNSVYMSFLEISGDTSWIVVRRKRPQSEVFERRSVRVTGTEFITVQFSSISVDLQGTVHVFFWGSKLGGSALWHARSTDGGESFTAPTQIVNVRFPTGGDSWTEVPEFLPQRLEVFPQFAVDNHAESEFQGNMYAVWCSNDPQSSQPGTFDEPLNVYVVYSTDGGDSWSSPARVHDDVPTFRADHFHPSIDVSPSGAVVVTWYDGRAAENNTKVNHYTTFSFDGGRTFVENIPVSSRPSNIDADIQGGFGIGDYTKVVSTSGYAVPLWSDGRDNNGDLNIYAAFVPLSPDAGTSGVERTTGIGGEAGIISVIPQPVAGRTEIRYRLDKATSVRVELVDLRGERVKTIWEGSREAGVHTASLDCSDIPSGWYFCRLSTPRGTVVQRVAVSH